MPTTINFGFTASTNTTQKRGNGIFARVRAGLTARRQRRALLALDDRMLSDIGITRGQAYGEADRSIFDLPERHR